MSDKKDTFWQVQYRDADGEVIIDYSDIYRNEASAIVDAEAWVRDGEEVGASAVVHKTECVATVSQVVTKKAVVTRHS